jgi:hypothetical protein
MFVCELFVFKGVVIIDYRVLEHLIQCRYSEIV